MYLKSDGFALCHILQRSLYAIPSSVHSFFFLLLSSTFFCRRFSTKSAFEFNDRCTFRHTIETYPNAQVCPNSSYIIYSIKSTGKHFFSPSFIPLFIRFNRVAADAHTNVFIAIYYYTVATSWPFKSISVQRMYMWRTNTE